MKKKRFYATLAFSAFLLLPVSLCAGLSVTAFGYTQEEQLRMYADYLENTDIFSYLYQSELFLPVDFPPDYTPYITRVQFIDYFSETDEEYELYLQGSGASANNFTGILDIQGGKVCSVFNEYGTVWGSYYDEITGQDLLVILEGNGADFASHFRISGYNACWDQIILAEMYTDGNYKEAVITDRDGNRIDYNEWDALADEIEGECSSLADICIDSSDLGYGQLSPSDAAAMLLDHSSLKAERK